MIHNSESKKAVFTLVGSIVGLWVSNKFFRGERETLWVLIGGGLGAIAGNELVCDKKQLNT